MGKLLLLFILSFTSCCQLRAQSVTVDDLLSLTSLSPKNADSYLSKKGLVSAGKSLQNDLVGTTFVESNKLRSKDTAGIVRSVSLYKKEKLLLCIA